MDGCKTNENKMNGYEMNENEWKGYEKINFRNAEELSGLCRSHGLPVSEIMLRRECGLTEVSRKDVLARMGRAWEIMKESARTAISLVRSLAPKYGIRPDVFDKTDIHIHVPEGAIPKDGPSAGITMATAILSAFTKKPVSGKVAMTGEITLRGKVLPIGGLKEKTLAAYRMGIRKIIIPKENIKDMEEVPADVREKLDIVPAEEISTVFENSLVNL